MLCSVLVSILCAPDAVYCLKFYYLFFAWIHLSCKKWTDRMYIYLCACVCMLVRKPHVLVISMYSFNCTASHWAANIRTHTHILTKTTVYKWMYVEHKQSVRFLLWTQHSTHNEWNDTCIQPRNDNDVSVCIDIDRQTERNTYILSTKVRETHMYEHTVPSIVLTKPYPSASNSSGGSIEHWTHATTESIKVESALLAKSVQFSSSSIHVWIIVAVHFFVYLVFHFSILRTNRNICIR